MNRVQIFHKLAALLPIVLVEIPHPTAHHDYFWGDIWPEVPAHKHTLAYNRESRSEMGAQKEVIEQEARKGNYELKSILEPDVIILHFLRNTYSISQFVVYKFKTFLFIDVVVLSLLVLDL